MTTLFTSPRLLLLERDGWEYVERIKGKSAVAIVAVTEERELVLIEQFRRPMNARVIELPAGLVGDEDGHDDPEQTARKELEEETGYTCDTVELLASGPTSPGITSETVSLYRARGLRKVGEGGGVGSEDITVHLIGVDEVVEWLRRRENVDLKVWAALCLLA